MPTVLIEVNRWSEIQEQKTDGMGWVRIGRDGTYPASKALRCCGTIALVQNANECETTWNQAIIVGQYNSRLKLL